MFWYLPVLALKPGHRLGDPFCCARAQSNDVFFFRAVGVEKDISLDRAQAQQKGSPKRCPGFNYSTVQ